MWVLVGTNVCPETDITLWFRDTALPPFGLPDARCRVIPHLQDRFDSCSCEGTVVEGVVRIPDVDDDDRVAEVYRRFSDRIDSVTLARPTLEDVFVAKTGRGFEVGGNDG